MNSELVSVVIPTYNRAEMLREAIASVLAQTYENFELLVLDNCSPDQTPEVVASFKDHRIKYLRHQCNIGPEANWAYGVYWAKGKYLSFLCDDDKYKPGFLKKRVDAFGTAPGIVVVYGPFEYWDLDTDTTHLGGILPFASQSKERLMLKGPAGITGATRAQLIGASLYLSAAVRENWGMIFTGGKCGDEMLNVRLALQPEYTAVYVSGSDLLYRKHAIQDSKANFLEVAEDGERVYEYFLKSRIRPEYKRILLTKLLEHRNRNARICWDSGNIAYARNFFLRELKLNPFRLITWLRLLRCFVVWPKSVPVKQC